MDQIRETHRSAHRYLVHGGAIALLVFLVMLFTNPSFSFLDDEISIICAANAPVALTIRLFLNGQGQHEHPPLSDLLLHFWLPIAGVNPSLIRVPSMLFYAVALVILAVVARKLSGPTAFYTTLIAGALWPFGFHFGRMAGWYSFCFLLIALLTLAYLRFLDAPNYPRWLLVVGISLALVASNYFGWLVVGLIAVDAVMSLRGRSPYKYLLPGLMILIAGYGPLWRTLAYEVSEKHDSYNGGGAAAWIAKCATNVYSLFVSESVAPWFWKASIIASVAIVCVLLFTLRLIEGTARRLYLGFFILLVFLIAGGILDIKRMLFISGWLLVAIGCAVANRTRRLDRILLAASLCIIAITGWAGIIARKYYSTQYFIEPWATVADSAARKLGEGDTVVSNSAAFLFYLNTSLHKYGLPSNDMACCASGPHVISLLESGMPESGPHGEVLFVTGVNVSLADRTTAAENQLESRCRLESTTRLLPDSGHAMKKRFFHPAADSPYRVTVQQFGCGR